MQINENDCDLIFDIISRYIEQKYSREMIRQLKEKGETPFNLINKVKEDFLTAIGEDAEMWSYLQLHFYEVTYAD